MVQNKAKSKSKSKKDEDVKPEEMDDKKPEHTITPWPQEKQTKPLPVHAMNGDHIEIPENDGSIPIGMVGAQLGAKVGNYTEELTDKKGK